MRELFSDREYLAYFVARQSARLGFNVEAVAIAWQIYALRHSAFDLGLVGLMLFLPQLLLAIPAGMLADHFDRRIVCVICSIGEASAELLFVALVLLHVQSIVLNLGAVLVIGIAHSLGDPAETSLLAGIVKSKHYVRAQALSASLGRISSIAGPAIGGLLLSLGTPYAFAVAGASYAVASAAFSFLTPRDEPENFEAKEAIGGIRFIFSQPTILGAISLDLFAVLFGGAVALLPIFATQILHVGALGFGILRAAPALGSVVVAMYIARHPIERNAGALLLWCVAGFGIATIVFGYSHNAALSAVALAATGAFDIVSVVIRSALVQLGTPDDLRGRVSAIENIFIGASNELGAFESGTLAGFIGPVGSVVAGGFATLIVIALWMVLFPRLRTYDRLTPTAE